MARPPLVTVNFDDLSGGSANTGVVIPEGYYGLRWKNSWGKSDLSSFDPSNLNVKHTGFQTGLTSGSNIAFTASPLIIEREDGGIFSLETINITAGWYSFLRVTFDGYRDGVLVYHKQRGLDDLAPSHPHLHFDDVDKVVITQLKGIQDPRFHVESPQIVLDDLVFRGIDVEAKLAPTAEAFGEDHHAVSFEHFSATLANHSLCLVPLAFA